MTRRQALVLTASCGVAAMTTLDTTVVNVALPSIKAEFNAPITSVQWVVTSYTVVFAILMVPAGRIADLFGRERMWAAGAATFAIASLASGAAPSLELLLASRVVQGIGGRGDEADDRGDGRGDIPSRTSRVGAGHHGLRSGGRCGPRSGDRRGARRDAGMAGDLPRQRTHRSGGILVMRRVAAPGTRAAPGATIDVAGAGVLGSCLLLIILALTQQEEWGGQWTLAMLAAAAGLGVALVVVELRQDAPMLELRLLRRPAFAAGNVVTLLTSLGSFAAFFLQSLYLQEVAGFSILESGLLLAPLGIATLLTSTVGGRFSDRVGARVPIALGLTLCAAGLGLLWQAEPDSSYLTHVMPAYILEGAGWGLASAPLNSAVISAAGIDRAGEAAGVMSTLDKFGAALGVAAARHRRTARGRPPRW